MSVYKPRTVGDKLFLGSLILKGLSGLVEFTSGLLLVFVSPASLQQFVAFITQRQLGHYHHDKIATLVLQSTQQLGTSSRTFIILYLWVHAAINLLIAISLLKNQRWAYPFSMVALGAFLAYQIYVAVFAKASIGLIGLILFDTLVLWLIWREYQKLKA